MIPMKQPEFHGISVVGRQPGSALRLVASPRDDFTWFPGYVGTQMTMSLSLCVFFVGV